MLQNINRQTDEINLLKIIKQLCTAKIRSPMTFEQTKMWLKQFSNGPEKMIALLILRHLIFRTSEQLNSALKQSLKSAATSPLLLGDAKENVDWRNCLNGSATNLSIYCGPPKHAYTPPGKSGEIIARQLKTYFHSTQLKYPDQFTNLTPDERYLLVDDGTFTGLQLIDFIKSEFGAFMRNSDNQCGIVVGLAHETAINNLQNTFPNTPIFWGEKISPQECFVSMCANWATDGTWPFSEITPLDQYLEVVNKAKFQNDHPLGFGSLGCMVAYEHGAPDDSLQLLWDKSPNWSPLFER